LKVQGKTLSDALQELIGLPLCSIEFVMDYVQLHFGGPTLTAFTRPSLHVGSTTLRWDTAGFRDSLCALIQIKVAEARVLKGEEVDLRFENGTTFSVSLRETDYSGPEALEFVIDSGPSWIV
jgi:hypothetical protein